MDQVQAIRGTRDILPAEAVLWQQVEAIARTLLQRAGYAEIRTPIFEATDLFVRGIGTATDVVDKEMYSFRTRGDREITLRPENTAGVVRAYIQNNLQAAGDAQRLWYCGPMFRYERPQAGRQRQFHQLGLEVLGSASPRADAEVVAIAIQFLQALGIPNLTVRLNSVGDAGDRQAYRAALLTYLTPQAEALDPDSQARLQRNPLRILDSKDSQTQKILEDAPQLQDYLGPESRRHFERVQGLLQTLGIPFELDPKLVRGLDYYTHTAFEIQSSDLGAQSAVCGGGRYDGLVSELGGPPTPAVGWAMGLERLILLLQGRSPHPEPTPDVYLISRGEQAEDQALVLAQQLRQAGLTAHLDLSGSQFGKQLKRADRSGATWAVLLGDEEAATQSAQVKHLQAGSQETLPQSAVLATIQNAIQAASGQE